MDPIVELRNVTKRYGEHAALEDFSLQVRRGEFLTLLGPSGSGKTTVLRLIAGFESPQSGEILLEGRAAGPLPPYRRSVNTVFQHYALFPHLNVFRNVAFGLEERKLRAEEIHRRVLSMLELVELPGKEDRYPHQLSGGEKQRVALARALVLEPAVLLLDEPLGALDEKLRKQMQVELKRLRERLGVTFIFVTHDQQEALVMSDRVAVLNRGRLEQVANSREIYEYPRTRFVAEFMGVENFFEVSCTGRAGNELRFRTLAGDELFSANSVGIEQPSKALLAVRPERLQLASSVPEAPPRNLLQGTVRETLYEGGTRRCTVELADGARLVAREPSSSNSPASEDRAPGSKVYVFWEPGRSLVFPPGRG